MGLVRMSVEPLGAVDAAFLAIEDDRDPMHIALAGIFEKGPLALPSGKLDRERIHRYALQVLGALPQFRRRVLRVPFFRRAFYADDPEFDLDYHLRFVELDPPGDDGQLKGLLGRIYTEPLSRDRPLWQMWCIDGLEGNRFATVTKTHHCLVDGIAGIAVVTAMLRTTEDAEITETAPWTPAPPPSSRELLRAYFRRRSSDPKVIWSGFREAVRSPRRMLGVARDLLRASMSLVRVSLPRSSKTILNPRHVGPERAFDWVRFRFEDVHRVKSAAGATINDVVLAIVAGAVRRYLFRHRSKVDRIRFRVMVPVSLHEAGETHLKNEVAFMVGRLPIDEEDPKRRLERIVDDMRGAKSSGQSRALGAGEVLAEHTFPSLVSISARIAIAYRPFNMIVTNIPGPPVPLYMLGARLIDTIPMVPLYVNQSVGIAILSYAGGLYFGLNADEQNMHDLPRFAACLLESSRELTRAYATSATGAAAE